MESYSSCSKCLGIQKFPKLQRTEITSNRKYGKLAVTAAFSFFFSIQLDLIKCKHFVELWKLLVADDEMEELLSTVPQGSVLIANTLS